MKRRLVTHTLLALLAQALLHLYTWAGNGNNFTLSHAPTNVLIILVATIPAFVSIAFFNVLYTRIKSRNSFLKGILDSVGVYGYVVVLFVALLVGVVIQQALSGG